MRNISSLHMTRVSGGFSCFCLRIDGKTDKMDGYFTQEGCRSYCCSVPGLSLAWVLKDQDGRHIATSSCSLDDATILNAQILSNLRKTFGY